jgi:type IV pilus assembly protein PilA
LRTLRLQRRRGGFTLIEMTIVIMIISVLTALAITRFMPKTTEAKQSEAKKILKQIYVMQRAYHQEFSTYACDGLTASAGSPDAFAPIGVQIMSDARYAYAMAADSSSFVCIASANYDDDVTEDIWRIDETGTLVCTSDDSKS